jgi:hypothetical protein
VLKWLKFIAEAVMYLKIYNKMRNFVGKVGLINRKINKTSGHMDISPVKKA